jgi:hypothetical protein
MKIIAIRWLQRFQQPTVSLHQESAWVHMLLAILPQAEQSGLKTLGIRGVRRSPFSHLRPPIAQVEVFERKLALTAGHLPQRRSGILPRD